MADTDHARLIEALGDTHERRLIDSLQQLEERIVAILISAPTTEQRLFDLAYALEARTQIQQAISTTYLSEADAVIRQYADVIESLSGMYEEYGSFFEVSPDVIANLQRISFQGFQDIAVTFSDELANELYQNTLTGRPIEESIRTLRQKINGVYIQSDQVEIQRLVNIANAGGEAGEAAVRQLHQVYASDRTGRNMRRYASQMAHDSIMQFDASLNVAAGREVGADRWKYYGSIVNDTRDWCIRHKGKEYTEDQIRELWSTNEWAGKAPGDPFIVRGGYNCRHHWRPVFDLELD